MTPRATPTTTDITLRLPWPPAALSPNARGKWARIAAVTAYRNECKVNALIDKAGARTKGVQFPLRPPVEGEVTFILPDRIRRDGDNLIARFKPGFDALVDAGLMAGDDLRQFSWTWGTEQGTRKTAGVRVVLRGAL